MGKTKKEQSSEDAEMAKTEKARRKMMENVAKHIHSKVTNKSAVIKGQKIDFFNGQSAVDSLMDSKWTEVPKDPADSLTPYFPNRAAAADYCSILLRYHFFVRLNKIEVKPKPEITSNSSSSSGKDGENKGLRKRGDKDKEKVTDSSTAKKQGDGSDSESSKQRKKRKFKLEIHASQTFADSADELYFWRYEPTSRGTYLIGFAVVVGAIALTLQPLWPDSTRAGLWYLSMGLFGLMGTMVLLIIARWFVFGLVQLATFGKVHFWVFPNLDNEKTGFVESFRPLYSLEMKKPKKKNKKEKGSTKGAESKESTEPSTDTVETKDQNGSSLGDTKQQTTEMPI